MDPKDIAISPKPFLIRAAWEWLIHINEIPHLVIDTSVEGVDVPIAAIVDGHMVLNASPKATKYLDIGNIMTKAGMTMGGRHYDISFPTEAIVVVRSKTNPHHLFHFPKMDMSGAPTAEEPTPPPEPKPTKSRSHLTVVR